MNIVRLRVTDASFHPELKPSCIETFMPCPAFGLCVWQASPAMNTCGRRSCTVCLRHVVELVAKALADLIDRPPRDLLHVDGVRTQYAACRRHEMLCGDDSARHPLILVELVEFDIQADEIAAFPGNDQALPSLAEWINVFMRISGSQ